MHFGGDIPLWDSVHIHIDPVILYYLFILTVVKDGFYLCGRLELMQIQ